MVRGTQLKVAIGLAVVGVVAGAFIFYSMFIAFAIATVAICLGALAIAPLPIIREAEEEVVEEAPPAEPPVKDPTRLEGCSDLVCRLVSEGRYALLLREEIVENLEPLEQQVALGEMEECMGLVPEGRVVMEPWRVNEVDEVARGQKLIDVEPLYLDRHPVTNMEYQAFVDGGGYEQASLWEAELLPAVLEFVDQTGHPGPRYWCDGRFPEGTEYHPVVGICWYEAEAYARWVGKRLPTSPEWVKAGAWPVEAGGPTPKQRKFPWGEAMDRQKANLWGSRHNGTCSVHEYGQGNSVNGLQQLVGNVWEWTTTDFVPKDERGHPLDIGSPMKTIRGGAFDTYFDNQATCHFMSGDTLMARKHNIGFRCALSCCDVNLLDDYSDTNNEELLNV